MIRGPNILTLALAVLCLTPVAFGDSIELRSSARVEASEPIRLSDIANLKGKEALALANVVVIENVAEASRGKMWVEIKTRDIARALEQASANMSRLSISGATCTVRLAITRVQSEPETSHDDARPRHEIVDDVSGSTIRARVAESIGRLLNVEPGDLRLLFGRDDDEFLRQTTWGRRVVIQPTTSGSTSHVVVEVRVFSAGDARLLERRRLRIEAEVRRHVVVMQRNLQRGETVKLNDVERRELWMKVDGSSPIDAIDQAVGSIARRRVNAGSVLRLNDLEPPIMVRRGQIVTVHCLRSGFAVKSRARAMASGRMGEVVEFKLDGSARSFIARVNGPGEAVIDMDSDVRHHSQETE